MVTTPNNDFVEETFQRLCDLYRHPGWRAYVKGEVLSLAQEFPEMWGELPKRMAEAFPDFNRVQVPR